MARKNCGENWVVMFFSVHLTSGVPSTHLDIQHLFIYLFFCFSVTIKASSGGAQGLNIAVNFGSGRHRFKN